MQIDRTTGPASAGPLFDGAARVTAAATGAVLVALVTLVCAEALLRGGALFQVHFLLDRWPDHLRVWLVRAFVLAALVICVILAWKTKDLTLSSFARGKFAPTVLRTPLWIPQIMLPLGFSVLAFFLVEQLLLTFRTSEER